MVVGGVAVFEGDEGVDGLAGEFVGDTYYGGLGDGVFEVLLVVIRQRRGGVAYGAQ